MLKMVLLSNWGGFVVTPGVDGLVFGMLWGGGGGQGGS